jgi:hypothetical protein
MLSWLFGGFFNKCEDEARATEAEKPRKPKPDGWTSKVIKKLTITPRRGQVTMWAKTQHPLQSIEVMPPSEGPRKPEHIVPTGFQRPPSLWRDPWVILVVALTIAAFVAAYLHLA